MFSDNLKRIRKEKEFSQEQLAVKLNVVRQTVSKWEKGLSVPDADLLMKLAEVLDVTVDDLLGKKIDIADDENKTDKLSLELAKLNERLDIYENKLSKLKKKIIIGVCIALGILFIGAIYATWNDMWYEFGKNIYYMFNK